MPIAIACDCGKSGKVKEALAGKKVRCPGCGSSINVPLLAESLDDEPIETPALEPLPPLPRKATAAKPPPLPVELPPLPESAIHKGEPPFRFDDDGDDDVDDTPRKTKRKRSKYDFEAGLKTSKPQKRTSGVAFEQGWFGSINSGMAGGLLMMVIAVVWFVAGFAAGRIFFYPPVLFVIGLVAVIKSLLGSD